VFETETFPAEDVKDCQYGSPCRPLLRAGVPSTPGAVSCVQGWMAWALPRYQCLTFGETGEGASAVIDLPHLLGWRAAHFRPARTATGWRTPVAADGAGFPDLVPAKSGLPVIFAETKRERRPPRKHGNIPL
jgi:hypothetical protein